MAAAPDQLSKRLNRTLKEARQNASRAIFDTARIKELRNEVRLRDVEVNKAAAAVRKAQKELKKTPKPSKTLLQRFLSGGRGGGGGGGPIGIEVDIAGKIRRKQRILE